MNNYDFCVETILKSKHTDVFSVLDYGCGAGNIVARLREHGIEAFGCDIFYKDSIKEVLPGMLNVSIRKMEDNKIPFPDNHFDFVMSNMVLEHVDDLANVLSEMNRVLKPGGKALNIFPHKGVWREGHCGIPFLHWFPRGSSFRKYYAYFFRSMGLGYHKKGKSAWEWSCYFCDWIDKWTKYRGYKEVKNSFAACFTSVEYIEPVFMKAKLKPKLNTKLINMIPDFFMRTVTNKLGFLVILAKK